MLLNKKRNNLIKKVIFGFIFKNKNMMKKSTFFFVLLFVLFDVFSINAQSNTYIPYRKGNLWGFCDENKKIIIEPSYDAVQECFNQKNRSEDNTFFLVKNGKKWNVVNLEGEKILANPIDSIFYILKPDLSLIYFGYYSKNKVGVFNTDFEELTEAKFDKIENRTINDRITAFVGNSEFRITAKGKQYSVNRGDNLAKDNEENTISTPYREMFKKQLVQLDSNWVHLKLRQDYCIDSVVHHLHSSNFNFGAEVDTDIETAKNNLFNLIFRFFYVSKKGQYGILDISKENNSISFLKNKYDKVVEILTCKSSCKNKDFENKIILFVEKDNKIGVIDNEETVILPFKAGKFIQISLSTIIYQSQDKFYLQKLAYKNSEKAIVYDHISEKTISLYWPKYDHDENINNFFKQFETIQLKVQQVVKNGQKGYINEDGLEYFD